MISKLKIFKNVIFIIIIINISIISKCKMLNRNIEFVFKLRNLESFGVIENYNMDRLYIFPYTVT